MPALGISVSTIQKNCPKAASKDYKPLLQLSEILDGAYHLADVRVLLIVPGNNLYLIKAVAEVDDYGLGGVKQAVVTHTDPIGGDDRIIIAAEALGSGGERNRRALRDEALPVYVPLRGYALRDVFGMGRGSVRAARFLLDASAGKPAGLYLYFPV